MLLTRYGSGFDWAESYHPEENRFWRGRCDPKGILPQDSVIHASQSGRGSYIKKYRHPVRMPVDVRSQCSLQWVVRANMTALSLLSLGRLSFSSYPARSPGSSLQKCPVVPLSPLHLCGGGMRRPVYCRQCFLEIQNVSSK